MRLGFRNLPSPLGLVLGISIAKEFCKPGELGLQRHLVAITATVVFASLEKRVDNLLVAVFQARRVNVYPVPCKFLATEFDYIPQRLLKLVRVWLISNACCGLAPRKRNERSANQQHSALGLHKFHNSSFTNCTKCSAKAQPRQIRRKGLTTEQDRIAPSDTYCNM